VTDEARPGAPLPAAVAEGLAAFLARLLETLAAVEAVQRHLHPSLAARLAERLDPWAAELGTHVDRLEALAWPTEARFLPERLGRVGRRTVELVQAFGAAARVPGDPFGLYGALRRLAPVEEDLYPLAPALPPVSRWFLDAARRADDALVARLQAAALREDDVPVGVRHAANARDARGGFSVYVPETWDGATRLPLVMALHGGHGHGRDFLWSWLREARSRGVLLIAPTARERTWPLMGDGREAPERLAAIVAEVGAHVPVDRSRCLLTGMSDGATYALVCGLGADGPFTHLAPACGVLHPRLLEAGGLGRAHDRPVYLIHGAHDWMFPVGTARLARDLLLDAGARLVYREIEDLSHVYPRDENPRILDWLLAPP